MISVRAERRLPRQEGDELIVDERPQGIFTRQLFLGDNLDASSLTADFDGGVLALTIPIAEASKLRRIELGEQPPGLRRGHDDGSQPLRGGRGREVCRRGSAPARRGSRRAHPEHGALHRLTGA